MDVEIVSITGVEEPTVFQTDWITSKAKEILKEDIISGQINGWTPKEVYHDPSRYSHYRHYKYENFRTNLNNL